MKNNKGYTLIEIIVCVLLIAIIGTVFTMTLHKKKDNDETRKESKEQQELDIAIDILSNNLLSSNELNYYEDIENNKDSFFCLSKQKLIGSGLITENNELLNDLSEDTYIKVIKDKNGLYKMEKPVNIDSCKYLSSSTTSSVDAENEKTDGTLKDDGYQLKHKITSSASGEKNHYDYTLNFDLVTGDLVETLMNVYTVFVLDGSASMGSTFYTARDAAINLSEQLINSDTDNVKNYVSAITFSGLWSNLNRNPIDSETEFLKRKLIISDFTYGEGSTFYYAAFEGALKKLNEVKANKEKNKYFVIFLTDGDNYTNGNHDDYNPELNALKKFLKDSKIENEKLVETEYGKLIVVGYNYSGTGESELKRIASDGCEERECFYSSSTSNVIKIFQDFFKLIQNEVNCYYDAAKISINLAPDFYVASDNSKIISDSITFDCKTSPYYEELKKYGNNLFNDTKEIYFKKNLDDGAVLGETEIPIINSIEVTMQKYDESGNLKDVGGSIEITSDKFSKITLNIEEVEVVN